MTSHIAITAVGHIGSVEPFVYSQSGTPICKFSLAINIKADQVLWLKCVAFGKLAETVHPNLHPGKQVLIESNDLKVQGYLGGGIPKASADVVIKTLKYMGKREAEPEPQYAGFDDSGDNSNGLGDIPF